MLRRRGWRDKRRQLPIAVRSPLACYEAVNHQQKAEKRQPESRCVTYARGRRRGDTCVQYPR